MAVSEQCGKPAVHLVPRWGWYLVCMLDEGHEGPCKAGGVCAAHGPYVSNAGGHGCPQWPKCLEDILTMERERRRIDDQERDACLNPERC